MRGKRARVGCVAVVLGAVAVAAPAGAQAAKVTETAEGGALPAPTGVVSGEFRQEFNLKGGKVKGKQTLDVNVTLNATGGDPSALGGAQLTLIGPKGDNVELMKPGGGAWANLELDDQSDLVACDPAFEVHSDCNYPQGGTFVGQLHSPINPTFKGLNPKGTWTLLWQQDFGTAATTVGTTDLEVKTGKKFAKEGK